MRMKKRLVVLVFFTACVSTALAADATVKTNRLPVGAAAGGFTKCIINEKPTSEDISPDRGTTAAKWFSGQWYSKMVPLDYYSTTNGVLCIEARGPGESSGDLVSCPRKWDDVKNAKLPFLPGKDGFYVEFEVSLSDNNPDHFAALWLMPIEKILGKMPIYEGDPEGMERWMELDVDEAGFGPGLTGTVHNWWGFKYPNYHHLQNPNNVRREKLDRTARNIFGASYDPKTRTVIWWLNGKMQMSATTPYVPSIAEKQNFYLIMGAQRRSKKVPYKMYVHAVRAFTTPSSEIPAVAYDGERP
jgi:hypothetical protein